MKGKHIKKIILAIVAAIALGGSYPIYNFVTSNSKLKNSEYTVLKLGSKINTIDADGEIVGEEPIGVYSNVTYIIKQVNVEVGDYVKKGDILAVLDTDKLQEKIEELESSINLNDTNNKIQLEKAKAVYEAKLKLSSGENNVEVKNAEAAINKAKLNLDDKEKIYNDYVVLLNSGSTTEYEFNQVKLAYDVAKEDYNAALVAVDNVKTKIGVELATAKSDYESAKALCNDNTNKITLQNLKNDLSKGIITAPADGVISSKIAAVGNPSQGKLFEIKNINDLTVAVDVKEVDISNVQIGQKVNVETDCTGDEIIEGEVIKIQPIAKEKQQGLLSNSDDNDDAEFEVKIKLNEGNDKLKLGMKTDVEILIDENPEIYTVPVDCIVKKGEKNSLYIAEKQYDGKYVVKQIDITTGIESEDYIEVSSNELKEDLIILNDPLKFSVDQIINI